MSEVYRAATTHTVEWDENTHTFWEYEKVVLASDYSALLAVLRQCYEALADYGSHELPCLLAQWHVGRPTPDGGYETKYGDKWYQRDEKPACTCGFDDSLAAARAVLEGEAKP